MVLGQLDMSMQKSETGLHLISYIKVNSKWIKNLNVRPKTIKVLIENGEIFMILKSNDFLDMTQNEQAKKEKNRRM